MPRGPASLCDVPVTTPGTSHRERTRPSSSRGRTSCRRETWGPRALLPCATELGGQSRSVRERSVQRRSYSGCTSTRASPCFVSRRLTRSGGGPGLPYNPAGMSPAGMETRGAERTARTADRAARPAPDPGRERGAAAGKGSVCRERLRVPAMAPSAGSRPLPAGSPERAALRDGLIARPPPPEPRPSLGPAALPPASPPVSPLTDELLVDTRGKAGHGRAA